jgi:hypothetical protein
MAVCCVKTAIRVCVKTAVRAEDRPGRALTAARLGDGRAAIGAAPERGPTRARRRAGGFAESFLRPKHRTKCYTVFAGDVRLRVAEAISIQIITAILDEYDAISARARGLDRTPRF